LLLTALQSPRSTFVLILLVLAAGTVVSQTAPPKSERDAYEAAIHCKKVQDRTKGLELFLETFPSSTLKEAALESLARAYYQSGNLSNVQETLERLLKVNANSLYGLTAKAELRLLGCDSGDCEHEMASLAENGFRVLNSGTKPDYEAEAEFERQKIESAKVFHNLAGLAAIEQHDYQTAQEHYVTLVESEPNNFGFVYPLALTYLNSSSPDNSKGLFFLARAAVLSPATGRKKIEDYGRAQYEKYHGSAQGWPDVLRMAKANPRLPLGFAVAPAP
jgi:tetratricopeptide (TPR) repeat protein